MTNLSRAAIPNDFEYEAPRKLARQSPALAAIKLGQWYEEGHFVQTDYDGAIRWYRRAAEKGNPSAANSLGAMYEQGNGVTTDDTEAEKWYLVAASKPGSNRGLVERVAKKLTREQLTEAQRRAEEWLRAFPLKD